MGLQTPSKSLLFFPLLAPEHPAYTPKECFQRISRRLRSTLKRGRIPMVSWGHGCRGKGFGMCFGAVPELRAAAELLGIHTCSCVTCGAVACWQQMFSSPCREAFLG